MVLFRSQEFSRASNKLGSGAFNVVDTPILNRTPFWPERRFLSSCGFGF